MPHATATSKLRLYKQRQLTCTCACMPFCALGALLAPTLSHKNTVLPESAQQCCLCCPSSMAIARHAEALT